MSARNRVILWCAARHSGKTTAAFELACRARAAGFTVAGLLARSVYAHGELIGFDGIDLRNNEQARLSVCKARKNGQRRFSFTTGGIKLAASALSLACAKSADLVIVDEFGPLEMLAKGWRKNVDLLVTSTHAIILLVVRSELADEVEKLYSPVPSRQLPATDPASIDEVIAMLRDRRNCTDAGC